MDENEETAQSNMISNLPLLFANGYPTSLEKITETQLENFIPFMVQCSLGHINLQGKMDCSEPEWWPEDVIFHIPLIRPKRFVGNWLVRMKEIVVTCYQFHKSVFLLRFCKDLASYEQATLRFMNNQNSTTSLYDRRSNKLLVTFRNENMSFDQPQRSRKCLLQNKKNGRQTGIGSTQQIMVEPAPFDIYLCDNCDAELYSKEAMEEHEKTCNMDDDDDDDDVILCDTPEPCDVVETNQMQSTQITNNNNNGEVIKNDNENESLDDMRKQFLLNFHLCPRKDTPQLLDCKTTTATTTTTSSITNTTTTTTMTATTTVTNKDDIGLILLDKNRRMPRRNRAAATVTRCPTLPLSSPAGQLLLRTTKTSVSTDYLNERLERIERFCHATILHKITNKPKFFDKKVTTIPHCTFKKPPNYSTHTYVFPRRQFSQRRRAENFLFFNSSLIKRCRPISVRLKKMPESDGGGGGVSGSSGGVKRKSANAKLNIKLTRDTTPNNTSNWKITSQQTTTTSATAVAVTTEIIVDTINLCSSDEELDTRPKDNRQRTTKKLSSTSRQTNKHVNISTTTATNDDGTNVVATTSRTYLQKLNASAELTITPIVKAALDDNKMRPPPPPPPLIRIKTPSSQINDLMANAYSHNNHIRQHTTSPVSSSHHQQQQQSQKSSTPENSTNNNNNLMKPLRPVYILSNFGSNNAFVASSTTTANVTSITESPSAAAASTVATGGIINNNNNMIDNNNINNNNNNQENHQKVQKTNNNNSQAISNNNIRKRSSTTSATASTTPVEWLTSSRASVGGLTTNAVNVVGSTNVMIGHEQRNTKSLPLVTNFGSPSRVVSIDLTT